VLNVRKRRRSGREYTTIHIPKALAVVIDEVLEAGAYSSRSEFVKETIRKHLNDYGLAGLMFKGIKTGVKREKV
jgi:metal-responsive CopG/Arc/MetJ family transcriptional regulator